MVRRVDANDALLRELERLGATAAEIEAAAPGELTTLGARLTLLGPGRRLSFAEAAGLLAVTEDEMRDRWRAAGMPEPSGPGGGFREADLVIFSTTELAEAAFGEAGTQQLSRVVSESMARVARARWVHLPIRRRQRGARGRPQRGRAACAATTPSSTGSCQG